MAKICMWLHRIEAWDKEQSYIKGYTTRFRELFTGRLKRARLGLDSQIGHSILWLLRVRSFLVLPSAQYLRWDPLVPGHQLYPK